MNYDANRNSTVTKGEFRRVLEGFCFPMTTEQFHGVVNKVYIFFMTAFIFINFFLF